MFPNLSPHEFYAFTNKVKNANNYRKMLHKEAYVPEKYIPEFGFYFV